jgi:hypothetical protein
MQKRSITGKEFENSITKGNWTRKSSSPKLVWEGVGKNNIEKIKNSKLDVNNFKLSSKSKFDKYDIYNSELNRFREVKKYNKEFCKNYVLYSEPYFKIATRSQANKINLDYYNNFVTEFFNHHLKTGLFDEVVSNIVKKIDGIVLVDGFIPIDKLEFRTRINEKAWKGFYRITIEFRIKND